MENQTPDQIPNQTPAPRSLPKILAVIGLLSLAAIFYFAVRQPAKNTEDVPPSLTISHPKFQGLIKGDVVCSLPIKMYEYDSAKQAAYTIPAGYKDADKIELKQGIHFYHSATPIDVKTILDKNIVPKEGNKILLLHYPAADTNTAKQFAAYPGLNGQIAMTLDTVIPANEGIIIFSCKDTGVYKIKDETAFGSALPEILKTKTTGWILMPAIAGNTLQQSLKDYGTKIFSIWPAQEAGFDKGTFTKNYDNLAAAVLNPSYSMFWMKFGTAGTAADTVPTLTLYAFPGQNLPAQPGDKIILNSIQLATTANSGANLKSISFTQNGIGDLSNISAYQLFVSNEANTDGTMKNGVEVKGCATTTKDKIITVTCPKSVVTVVSYLSFLELRAKLSDTAKPTDTYQFGISKLDDIQLHETNFEKVNYSSSPEYIKQGGKKVDLPIFNSTYTIAAATPVPAKPAKPTFDTVTALTAKIYWENKAAGYRITSQVGACAVNSTKYQQMINNNSAGNQTAWGTNGQLLPNTTYSFTIAAAGDTNYNTNTKWSPESDCVELKTSAASVTEVAAAKPAVSNITATSADIDFKKSAAVYRIRYLVEGDCANYAKAESFNNTYIYTAPNNKATLGKLLPGTQYSFAIATSSDTTFSAKTGTIGSTYNPEIDPNWSAYGECVEFTTAAAQATPPSAPTNSSIKSYGSEGTYVVLQWNIPVNTGGAAITQYKVLFEPGDCTKAFSTTATENYSDKTLRTLINLIPNTDYQAQVTATNSTDFQSNWSIPSTCLTFKTAQIKAEVITLYKLIPNSYGACDKSSTCSLNETCVNVNLSEHICKPTANPLPMYQCNKQFTCTEGIYFCMSNYKCTGTASCLDANEKEIGKPNGTGYYCINGTYKCTQGLSCDATDGGCSGSKTCQ